MLKNILPRRLRRMRVIRGLTQRALADMAGLGRTTIKDLESGLAKDCKALTLMDICRVLTVSADYFLGLDDIPNIARKSVGGDAEVCRFCEVSLRNSTLHLPGSGECILYADQAGKSREYMAATYGFSLRAIDFILVDEYRMRSRTRQ